MDNVRAKQLWSDKNGRLFKAWQTINGKKREMDLKHQSHVN
jgi:hypothetical protein